MSDEKSIKKSYERSAKAQDVAARLPEMDLDAKKLASLIYGLRRRTKAGPGIEFFNFRHYENGVDNPHKIDWKSSAKRMEPDGSDSLLMRDREMEVTQTIYIWVDGSKSMQFKAPAELYPEQPPYTKEEAGKILAMSVGYLAVKSSERFTLLGSDLGLSGNNGGVDRMRMELDSEKRRSGEQDLPKLPVHRGKKLPQNSHVFIFSDFLCPLDEIAKTIDSLYHAGVKGHLVQILDPAEIEFKYEGHVKLQDSEDGSSYTLKKGEALKSEIEDRVRQHMYDIEHMVKKIPNWNYSVYITDQPLYEALVPLYGIRTNRMHKPTDSHLKKSGPG